MTNPPPPNPHQPYGTIPAQYGSPPGTYSAPASGGFLRRLSPGKRVGVLVGGGLGLALVLCCGGTLALGALAGDPAQTKDPAQAQAADQNSPVADADTLTQVPADSPTTPTATTPPAVAQPIVEIKTVTETQAIPFAKKTVNDASLPKGTTKVTTAGVAGSKKVTYQVTYTDGVETGRTVVSETVTKQPVTQVTAVGTKSTAQCDPNYSGACVPIASDVDCQGGSGNGPAYVRGPVYVVGADIYKLDSDGDGVACES